MISAAAVVAGRSHRLFAHNCQDAAVAAQPAAGCAFGFVFDGCGGRFRDANGSHPSRNESGALLLARFTAAWLATRLGPATGLAALTSALDQALVGYLTRLADVTIGDEPTARRRFVATHLLTTTLGYLITPRERAYVTAGDGFLVHDGVVCELNADNRPPYLGYRLLNGASQPILRHTPLPPSGTWLAVASDGWTAAQLGELATPRPNLQLQRRLNQLAQEPGYFADDAAVACWHTGAGAAA